MPDKSHARHLIWRKMCSGEDMKHWRFSASTSELTATGTHTHSRPNGLQRAEFLTCGKVAVLTEHQWQDESFFHNSQLFFFFLHNAAKLHTVYLTSKHIVSWSWEVPVVMMSPPHEPFDLNQRGDEPCEATLSHPGESITFPFCHW